MIEILQSPRLKQLETSWQEGHQERLEEFWNEITENGAPLWERDGESWLVTFLWRSEQDDNVHLQGGPAGWDAAQNKLERLGDTDIWFKTCRTQERLPSTYLFIPHDTDDADWTLRRNRCVSDPLNPHSFEIPYHEDLLPLTGYSGSVLLSPGTTRSPVLTRQPDVAMGELTEHRFASRILHDERSLYVHTPAGYSTDGAPYQVLFLFDGFAFQTVIPAPTILDNLLAAGQIRPTVTVLINNLHRRRNEELRGNDEFVRFVTQEVLPWVRENWHVTTDPAQSIIGGASNGGLCALYTAMKHPELFGGVLAHSGTVGWSPDGAHDRFLLRELASWEAIPFRFSLDVGNCEDPFILEANRDLHHLLTERGVPVHYREFAGTHDFLCWAEMFVGAAQNLLR